MTDTQTVQQWLDGYRRAWESNDEGDIRALFTDDATYRFHPYDDDPESGVEAIVAAWVQNRDEPGDFAFELGPIRVAGETAFVQAVTDYV
jgi:ketosteroid isomerase-like protein